MKRIELLVNNPTQNMRHRNIRRELSFGNKPYKVTLFTAKKRAAEVSEETLLTL